MKNCKFASAIFCVCMCVSATALQAQLIADKEVVALGAWLQEGTGSVTGSGDTFTATPLPIGIADTGDNFEERNLARHRVYQTFGTADLSGQLVIVAFDVTFDGTPNSIDAGFRMSLIRFGDPASGVVPIAFDTGVRSGIYNQAQFVSDAGDVEGGMFNDAFNSSSTIDVSARDPWIFNGASDLGLIDGNTLSFEVMLIRGFSGTCVLTRVTEANGDVVYEETRGFVGGEQGNLQSLDAIAFGIFDDTPFTSSGSYTVSSLTIATGRIPLIGDVDRGGTIQFADILPFIAVLQSGVYQIEADIDQNGVVDFADIPRLIDLFREQ